MSTETATQPRQPATPGPPPGRHSSDNLRDYGLVLALIAIMLFFQFTTNGVLFKPVNLTNLVLQNSYIIIMALGMLLVIVAGHIDLSVGSVSGFVGAVAAVLMVQYKLDPLSTAVICLIVGGDHRREPGLLDRLYEDPVLHRHAGRHAGVQGPGALAARRQVGRPLPAPSSSC